MVEFVYFSDCGYALVTKDFQKKQPLHGFMGSLIEERPCSFALPSHAVSGNFEHHLAKTQKADTLSWKDSLVDPENYAKQLDDRVQLLNFNSEVAIYDQQELVAFQQCRYNLSFAMAKMRCRARSACSCCRKGGWKW